MPACVCVHLHTCALYVCPCTHYIYVCMRVHACTHTPTCMCTRSREQAHMCTRRSPVPLSLQFSPTLLTLFLSSESCASAPHSNITPSAAEGQRPPGTDALPLSPPGPAAPADTALTAVGAPVYPSV